MDLLHVCYRKLAVIINFLDYYNIATYNMNNCNMTAVAIVFNHSFSSNF